MAVSDVRAGARRLSGSERYDLALLRDGGRSGVGHALAPGGLLRAAASAGFYLASSLRGEMVLFWGSSPSAG